MSRCRVDCGVAICYIMKQIAHGQTVTKKLLQRVIDGLGAEKFLNDKHRSWSLVNLNTRGILEKEFEE